MSLSRKARAQRNPTLRAGSVYRTRDLERWARNAPRLAKRLVEEGRLVKLAGGLFACPRSTKFGPVLPRDEAVIEAFLDGGPYVFTGPERWNALGLGSTALSAQRLVYNTKRSGAFELGGRRFRLRRVRFPRDPAPEWFVVDLLEHHLAAGVSLDVLETNLAAALRAGRFDRETLERMSTRFGTKATQAVVERALLAAGRA